MTQARVPVFFAVSRFLRYKYFDVVWGYGPLGVPPQNQSFERLNFWCQCFLISAVDILEMNILTYCSLGVPAPQGPPKTNPPEKSLFLFAQARALVFFFNISPYLRDECFDIICNLSLGPPKMDPPNIIFLFASN